MMRWLIEWLRKLSNEDVIIADAASLSGAFYMGGHGWLQVALPSGWDTGPVGFHVCATEGGTYQALLNEHNVPIQIAGAVASKTYTAPPQVGGSHWMKLESQDSAGAARNQSGAVTLTVMLKG